MGQGSPREELPKASRGPHSSLRSRSRSPTLAAASAPITTTQKSEVVPPRMTPPPLEDRPASILLPRRRGITFGEAPRLRSPTPPRQVTREPRMKAQLTPRPILRQPAPKGFARRNHAQAETARGAASGGAPWRSGSTGMPRGASERAGRAESEMRRRRKKAKGK